MWRCCAAKLTVAIALLSVTSYGSDSTICGQEDTMLPITARTAALLSLLSSIASMGFGATSKVGQWLVRESKVFKQVRMAAHAQMIDDDASNAGFTVNREVSPMNGSYTESLLSNAS
eukprot:COSAG05_NODE_1725_length_4206_cov_2.026784_5_plen_117_part_00